MERKEFVDSVINTWKKAEKEEFPSAQPSNPMRVGRVANSGSIGFLWQPHNYRLYFDFDRSSFVCPDPANPTPFADLVGCRVELKNHRSEVHFVNFYGCRLVVRRKQVEVINQFYGKRWRHVVASCVEDVAARVDDAVAELDGQCVYALQMLVKRCGGFSRFEVLKRRSSEHGVHGEDFLDSLPEDLVIRDTFFQKLYRKKVEFKSPVAVKNFISNRAVESVSPQIAEELAAVRAMQVEVAAMTRDLSRAVVPAIQEFSVNMRTHVSVLKGIDASFKRFNRLLGSKQTKLWEWM